MQQRQAQRILRVLREEARRLDNKQFGELYLYAVDRLINNNDSTYFSFLEVLEHAPISIEEFIDSDQFLGSTDLSLWPEVRKAIIEINTNWWVGEANGAITEVVLAGATSTGKTSIAIVTILYRLYLLSCLKQPQTLYGLPKETTIVIAIMAAKPHVTKKVIYAPIRKYVESMPYFQVHMQPDKQVESEMIFRDKNLRVAPGGADSDSILGEAIILGLMDEANFMSIVLRSKKAEISSGRPGIFDQATSIYNSMTRRRKGRFTYRGPNIGCIIVACSTRYRSDFTSKREADIRKGVTPNGYIYNKKQYEVQPADKFCGETFRVLVSSDMTAGSRILADDEVVDDKHTVLNVPIEYRSDFEKDLHGSLLDVCGVADVSITPFIRQRHRIYEAVERGKEEGLESFLEKDNVILSIDGMLKVKEGHFCKNPSKPRYVHIDLSINADRAGIVMTRFDGLIKVERDHGDSEMLPKATVEMAASIEPDLSHEVDIAEIRAFVKSLKDKFGYPIKGVTYDGFISQESIQQWRKDKMRAGRISVDKSAEPYMQWREALYDGRLSMYDQPVLIDELVELDYDSSGEGKVDHKPGYSKDVSDGAAGSYANMLKRRSSWMEAAEDDSGDMRVDMGERFDAPRKA